MAAWSAIYLIWKVKLAAYLTKSAAFVGLLVTFLVIIFWVYLGIQLGVLGGNGTQE